MSKIKDGLKKCAWCIIVYGKPKYFASAYLCATSLRLSKTCHDIVLLYNTGTKTDIKTDMDIEKIIKEFEKICDVVKPIDIIEFQTKPLKNKGLQMNYPHSFSDRIFTKFHVMELTQYAKVMHIDSDIFLIKNMDDLFSLKPPAATFVLMENPMTKQYNYYGQPEHGDKISKKQIDNALNKNGNVLSGSLWLIEPSIKDYNGIIEYVKDNQPFGFENCFGGTEEMALMAYFTFIAKKDFTHIHQKYQVVPWTHTDLISEARAYHMMNFPTLTLDDIELYKDTWLIKKLLKHIKGENAKVYEFIISTLQTKSSRA